MVKNVVSYVPGWRKTKQTAFPLRRPLTAVRVLAVSTSALFSLCFLFFASAPAKDGLRRRRQQPRVDVHAKERTGRAAIQKGPSHVRGKCVGPARSAVPGASSQFRRPFTAARHQRAIAVQGPEDGRARGRDGNAERTASPAKLDNRQPEESNKSTVFPRMRVDGSWWSDHANGSILT